MLTEKSLRNNFFFSFPRQPLLHRNAVLSHQCMNVRSLAKNSLGSTRCPAITIPCNQQERLQQCASVREGGSNGSIPNSCSQPRLNTTSSHLITEKISTLPWVSEAHSPHQITVDAAIVRVFANQSVTRTNSVTDSAEQQLGLPHGSV